MNRENIVRSLAYLFTREELKQLRLTLARRNDARDAALYGLLNDAELGDWMD